MVGPAVNETSRIAAMCRLVEQLVLVSKTFANVEGMCGRLVSVGRYALRGVVQPQELFTLDFAGATVSLLRSKKTLAKTRCPLWVVVSTGRRNTLS